LLPLHPVVLMPVPSQALGRIRSRNTGRRVLELTFREWHWRQGKVAICDVYI